MQRTRCKVGTCTSCLYPCIESGPVGSHIILEIWRNSACTGLKYIYVDGRKVKPYTIYTYRRGRLVKAGF